MKFEIEYRKNYVKLTIQFIDADGCHSDGVRVDKWQNDPARVFWPIPGNNSLENARMYADAIDVAIKAAEVIDAGKRLEDEWGPEVQVVIDETQPA